MRSWLLVALIALAPFAGCLDDNSSGLTTAKESLSPAQKRAEQWSSDAVLVSASSIELSARDRDELRHDLDEYTAEMDEMKAECAKLEDSDDRMECMEAVAEAEQQLAILRALARATGDRVGDGVAPLWAFMFTAPSSDDGFVVVMGGRTVLMAEEVEDMDGDFTMFGGDLMAPLGNWSIDSDDAAKAAARGDAAYQSAITQASTTTYSLLAQVNERAYWLFGAETPDEDDEIMVAVDAANGTVVSILELLDGFMPLLQEAGTLSGTFMAVTGTSQQGSFEIELTGHEVLAIQARISPPPVQPVSVAITDAAGEVTQFAVQMTLGVSTAATGSTLISDVPAGKYDVRLTTSIATREGWTVNWCTDGIGFSGFGFNSACSLVPQSASQSLAASEMISHWRHLAGL